MQKQVSKPTQEKAELPVEVEGSDSVKRGAELADALDELLDEIDAVLEENAETFVKQYVQRGGE